MRKIWQICLLLCFAMLLQLMVLPAQVLADTADPSVTQGCRGIDSEKPFLGTDQKIANAQAIFLYETTTDTLMYAWNADKPMYPASLVKIMTALVAIEQADVSELVTVKATALADIPSDATSVDLVPDEVLTLDQLLYCLMVASGNDAAAVIADHVGGSERKFVHMMNQRAEELGCTGTKFTNSHGLHDDEQVTTARDVGRILNEAMKNEKFCEYFTASYFTVEPTNKSEERNLTSNNHMTHMSMYEIYYDGRVLGGRTGVTTNGTRCIATAAASNNMKLVCVVMGCNSTYVQDSYIVSRLGGFDETSQMLDFGFKGHMAAQLLYENQALQQHTVVDADSDLVVGPQKSVSSVLPVGTDVSRLNYRYSMPVTELRAPIDKGTHILDLEIWNGNICVAYAPLYAMNSVKALQTHTVDTSQEAGGSLLGTILTVLLVLAVAAVAVLLILRFVNRRRAASGRRPGRSSRRKF